MCGICTCTGAFAFDPLRPPFFWGRHNDNGDGGGGTGGDHDDSNNDNSNCRHNLVFVWKQNDLINKQYIGDGMHARLPALQVVLWSAILCAQIFSDKTEYSIHERRTGIELQR